MKIEIIGSVASGKTTLAEYISRKYEIPFYQKDNVVWLRTENGDRKRTPEERDLLFQSLISQENWIVEGSPRDCLNESFPCCDTVIILDIPLAVRAYRVLARWVRQRLGREKYNSRPTVKFLFYNFQWIIEFNLIKKDLYKRLSPFQDKTVIFRRNRDALSYINHLGGR